MHLKFPILALLLTALPLSAETVPEWTTNDGQMILQGVPDIPASLTARLKQYQNVRFAKFLDWTRDGKGMYIRTRFGEVSQVHRVDFAGGTRRQLTWFAEPVGQVERRQRHDELAITMDRGGGEQDQILLFDPKSGSYRRLTDGESRNRLVRWRRDGKRMAYQSTRRNGRSNDLWIMDPDRPESATLLQEAPDGSWLGPADFSKDGDYLLVQQFLSVDDSRIHVLDLRDGSIPVSVGGGEYLSANRAVAFDRRGEGFFFITNGRGQAAELAWQSLDPDVPIEYVTRDIPWDVSEFALSPDGSRGAFVTNEEGISKLYLLNVRSRRFNEVGSLPLGIISNLAFNADNRRLALDLNTAQTPSDVYVLELGKRPGSARKLKRWTYSEVGGLETSDFARPRLVHFPTFDLKGEKPRRVPAFLYKPKGKGPFPVIIQVHGGPESQYRPGFSPRTQMWVSELGAAVIAPNIRGSSGYDSVYLSLDNGVRREDAIKDIGALLDWIAEEPYLDEDRVAIYGASYGGYVVLASAVHFSDRLRAGVDVVGISNFVTFLENTEDYRRAFRRFEYGDERDPEMRAFLQSISPLNNVDRIDIPLLVVQGRNDPRVPASESEQIVNALRHNGQTVWYIEALNEGHGYERKENRNVYEQATILFLQHHLLG
ncbi:MAG: S9 family peptidase, partial [Xanthomonadales bacterium]|nr:S9 family peptidase [Xanthomonadales bacterium]